MYFPYFRGKQFELITIREHAPLLSANGFVPIVEPVKESITGLTKAFDAIADAKGRGIIVVNPSVGDFTDDPEPVEIYATSLQSNKDIAVGILLTETMSVEDVVSLYDKYAQQPIALIHNGFVQAGSLKKALGARVQNCTHVFVGDKCNILYRKHFKSPERVIIRNGFNQSRNRDYPPIEPFSDLHVTYAERGVDGFGDYLIVGEEYSEGGGPAYAVAIHLTFIDATQDDQMFVYHFVSDRNSSPKDPAGKFSEALAKLVQKAEDPASNIIHTSAVKEFFRLHKIGHFPGLGSVKKLSMIHHIETLASDFQESAED